MAYAVKILSLFCISFGLHASAYGAPLKGTNYDRTVRNVFPNKFITEYFQLNQSDYSPFKTPQVVAALESQEQESFLSMNLNDFLNVESFYQLNHEVAQAWAAYRSECAKGNSKKAIEFYRKKSKCAEPKQHIRSARNKVKLFLLDGNFKSFRHSEHYRCNSIDESVIPLENCGEYARWDDYKEEIRLGLRYLPLYKPVPVLAKLNETSKSLFASLDLPEIHPLFFQLVLEAVAEGFPLPFGGNRSSAPGVSLGGSGLNWGSGENIVDGSRHWGWGFFGPFTPRLDEEGDKLDKGLSQFAHELIETNQIPSLTRSLEIFDVENNEKNAVSLHETIERLRLGFSADRLIPIMTYLQPDPDTWGLWPEASERLLSTFQLNHYHPAGDDSALMISYTKLIVDNRMANDEPVELDAVVNFKKPFNLHLGMVHIVGGTCESTELAEGSCQHSAINLLREVGAWRKLWHMQ